MLVLQIDENLDVCSLTGRLYVFTDQGQWKLHVSCITRLSEDKNHLRQGISLLPSEVFEEAIYVQYRLPICAIIENWCGS